MNPAIFMIAGAFLLFGTLLAVVLSRGSAAKKQFAAMAQRQGLSDRGGFFARGVVDRAEIRIGMQRAYRFVSITFGGAEEWGSSWRAAAA